MSSVLPASPTVSLPKRRIEVVAGLPTTGPQPGLCYTFPVRLSLFGDVPVGDFCDADDGASDGTATYGRQPSQLVAVDFHLRRARALKRTSAGEQEKVIGPFDQFTNPHVVTITTIDNAAAHRR